METVNFSIVIPTWKRAALVEKLLSSLNQERNNYRYGQTEVLVVDSSEGEEKERIEQACRKYNARYIEGTFSVRQKRNKGIDEAVYDYVLFVDSDVTVKKGLLDDLEVSEENNACSVYVDASADIDMAVRIAVDSKTQYPAACNAAETFLVHRDIAPAFLPKLGEAFRQCGVKIHGDEETRKSIPDAVPATEDDFHTEYLSLECAVKVVQSIDEAIEHIAEHGSHHTDSIVASSDEAKDLFFRSVDSADVFANCSTRFADGFRFGLGAEVGISTSKIHARGPVGLEGLMTTKWLLSGNGEIVADYSGADGKSFHHKELM